MTGICSCHELLVSVVEHFSICDIIIMDLPNGRDLSPILPEIVNGTERKQFLEGILILLRFLLFVVQLVLLRQYPCVL